MGVLPDIPDQTTGQLARVVYAGFLLPRASALKSVVLGPNVTWMIS